MPYRKRTKVMKRKPRNTKMTRKVFSRTIKGNHRTFRATIQGLYSIANSTASAVDIACSVFMNTPGYIWDNTGARIGLTNFSEQFDKMANLFDTYRVNALKVSWLPGYEPNSTSENTLYMINDNDDYALLSQVKALSAGATIYSRVIGATKKISKIFKNPDKRFINMNLAQTAPTAGYAATATLPVDFFKSMKLVFGQVPANLTIGQICIEYDITFKDINTNNT